MATKERPAPTEAGQPAALRAKGIDNEPPPMTYSGPAEDGSTEVRRTGGGGKHAAPSGSRRERREAARQQARETKRRG